MIPKYRVLMITSEWPSQERPEAVPFITRQVNFLRNAGQDIDVFHFQGNKNPLTYFKSWLQVSRKINTGNYDLIHAQWGQSALLALPKRKPLVVTFRGDDVNGIIGSKGEKTMRGRILQGVTRLAARCADEIIVVSEDLGKNLGAKQYHVIPSGIDLDLFNPLSKIEARRQLGLPDEKKYILFAGDKKNPRKRFRLVQEVAEIVHTMSPEVELLVASKIRNEQMPIYMNASNVLLLLSIHEGSPNVVKEALACNLPILATDVGDVRQRISLVSGCTICNDLNPQAIACQVNQMLYQDTIIDGRKTILDLDEKVMTQKVIEVYQQALNNCN